VLLNRIENAISVTQRKLYFSLISATNWYSMPRIALLSLVTQTRAGSGGLDEFGQTAPKILPTLKDCGGLTLAGCLVPTKATPSLHSSAGQGKGKKKNRTKDLWVEIRTERSLTDYHHGQNRLISGNEVNLLSTKTE